MPERQGAADQPERQGAPNQAERRGAADQPERQGAPNQAERRGGRDRIELRGLRLVGTHGVLAEERERSQPFQVDLDIVADLSRPSISDELVDTIDYGAVVGAVAGVVSGTHADLLEHLAGRIVDAVFATAGPLAEEIWVRVTKLRPPVPLDLASSAVSLVRSRP